MSDLDAILASLPIDALANQLGESPDAVRQAAQVAVPALLGGLHANAQGGGAASILEALTQHAGRSTDDPAKIDAAEGAKIASHIFGSNQDQVVKQLGASGGASSGLINKLLPLLAPMVMAWLASRLTGHGQTTTANGASDTAGGGLLGQVLGQVLGGGGAAGGSGAGGILGGILGGLLGGGRK